MSLQVDLCTRFKVWFIYAVYHYYSSSFRLFAFLIRQCFGMLLITHVIFGTYASKINEITHMWEVPGTSKYWKLYFWHKRQEAIHQYSPISKQSYKFLVYFSNCLEGKWNHTVYLKYISHKLHGNIGTQKILSNLTCLE